MMTLTGWRGNTWSGSCAVQNDYSTTTYNGPFHFPPVGVTHAEMIEKGWRLESAGGWHPQVWPVVAMKSTESEPLLRVIDETLRPDNLAYQAAVPCTWEPKKDRENAIRIGKELVSHDGNLSEWIKLD